MKSHVSYRDEEYWREFLTTRLAISRDPRGYRRQIVRPGIALLASPVITAQKFASSGPVARIAFDPAVASVPLHVASSVEAPAMPRPSASVGPPLTTSTVAVAVSCAASYATHSWTPPTLAHCRACGSSTETRRALGCGLPPGLGWDLG